MQSRYSSTNQLQLFHVIQWIIVEVDYRSLTKLLSLKSLIALDFE
jgi:hypothetical protein